MTYLIEYVRFDPDKYVKGYMRKKRTIDALKQRLQALDGHTGLPVGEKVQTSLSTDKVVDLVAIRLQLESQIESYEQHIKDFEQAREILSDDERTAIEIWFSSDTTGQALCRFSEIGLNKNKAYHLKATALETIQRAIVG